MAYVADTRTRAEIVAELARVARRTPVPASMGSLGGSWADLLFGGDALLDETEPSQTLLAALATLHGERGLLAHFDTLPASARRWFAQVRLGIQPLPTRADTVVLVVDADPKRTPVVLPKGSAVKAGKDDFGGERVYETQEALTVLGVPVVGAKTWYAPDVAAIDRLVEVGPKLDPPPAPFAAFGADAAGGAAVHRMYIASDLLALGTGTYTLTARFDGVSIPATSNASKVRELFESLTWRLSGPKDAYVDLGTPTVKGGPATVELEFSVSTPSAPMDVGGKPLYHLTAELDDASTKLSRKHAFELTFADVRLSLKASGVLPDSGFFNDGVIDVSKEFKPFGPVPQAGDSFGLRSDTAFSKPLKKGSVLGVRFGSWSGPDKIPPVSCQRFVDGRWQQFSETGYGHNALYPKVTSETSPFSEPASLGGVVGNIVRIVLADDFGWSTYQQTLVDFVNGFATKQPATMSAPPDPRVNAVVTIDYETAELSLKKGQVAVYAVNGPSAPQRLKGGKLEPFRHDTSGQPGVLYVGFGGAPSGETLSLYVAVDQQSVCDAGQVQADVTWQYRGGGTWKPLNVVDHTDDLRQSGIVRFAVPDDWQPGAAELSDSTGYWIRATSAAPQLGGRIERLRTDAVEALYRLAADWAHDTTPATPLAPETAKQLKVAVPGLKKVDNPDESWGGRGPEPADAFARRTSRVLRHRNRAITAWDVETLVTESFPDVGLVRCLPHHSYDSECAPGWFSAVLVPRSLDRLPRPSVQLAAQVEAFLHDHATGGLWLAGGSHIAILCPKYAEALVSAKLVLQPGVQGGQARDGIAADLSEWLRPLGPNPDRSDFGRSLFLSSVVWWLESRGEVAYVESCAFGGDFAGLDRIDVDGCRGLVASAAAHDLHVEPQL